MKENNDRMKNVCQICKENDRIVIYGAGATANIFYLYLKKEGLADKVECFVVTKMLNNNRTKYGKSVKELEQITEKGTCIIIATQKINHAAIENNLITQGYNNFYFADEEGLIHNFYKKLYEKPIRDNTILFMNLGGRGYGGNPKYIAEELRRRNKERNETDQFHLIWAVSDLHEKNGIPDDVEQIEIGSEEYYAKVATSKVWIDNVRKSGDIRKREGQIYIQLWHGAAPIKKVEKDVESKLPQFYIVNAKRDSQMADLFISGSEFYTGLYRKSFWYNGEILKVGLPRQDVFWHMEQARKKVFQYYNIDHTNNIVLYAPTFRNDYNNKAYDLDIGGMITALKKRFGKDYICAVSKHPDNMNIRYNLVNDEKIIYVQDYPDFEELLAAADILISDYSGCMYDFSFTGRPIFLYQKDIDLYQKDRDFYISMEKLPYIKSVSNQELQQKILSFDNELYSRNLKEFMTNMDNYDEGNASEKVANKIIEMIQEGKK